MVEGDQLQELVINNVVHENVIGKGANGKIFKGKWEGTPCAIKEIHSIFAELASEKEFTVFKSAFIEECCRSIRLRHPNIVQFLGIYFRPQEAVSPHGLPCLVMELLHSDLTTLLSDNPVIPYGIKLSMLNDVALGVRFLHRSTPSIIHRDLSSNNVLVTRGYVAKIGDLGTARFLNPNRGAQLSRMSQMTKAPGTVDFMSPEVLFDNPQYGTPLDVFSFACVSLHTITHQWPTPTAPVYTDPVSNVLKPRSEVERRSSFFDMFDEETLSLKTLLMQCLENDPKARPTIIGVCDTLLKLRGPVLPQNVVGIQSDRPSEINKLELDNAASYWNQLRKVWGNCANLPKKERVDTVAVINGKIYVTGNSQDSMFCYCSATDTWSTLPMLPMFGFSLACVSETKQLLAIGGASFKKQISSRVRLFHTIDKCWHDDYITCKMSVARYNATAVCYQSSVIIVGGLVDADMTTTQTVEVLKVIPESLSSSYWYRVQSMPYGTAIPMTAIINDTFYVAGGYIMDASMCYMTSVSITELLNSKGNTPNIWSDISPLPCSTSSFTSYKEHLLIFGGDHIIGASNKRYSWKVDPSIYIYHSKARQWEKVGKIPCNYYLGRCTHLTPSKIVFLGGQMDVSSTSADIFMTQCKTLDLHNDSQPAEDNDKSSSQKSGNATLRSCRQQ